MRGLPSVLVLLLTATAAQALYGPGNFTEQAVAAASLCCVFPVMLLNSVIVWLICQRKERVKNTDPRWSLSELPPFPPPGAG